jgi:hypothetical protein
VSGQIESVTVTEAKRSFFSSSPRGSSPLYVVELGYSYSIGGKVEAGFYKREAGTEAEASEFVRDLKGKPVVVHYNPEKPASGVLSEASIETLLQTRAPRPAWELSASSASGALPEWLQPFVWVFIGISAVGFVVSLWVHFGAVAGRRVAPAPFFWILHIGIFVVWFPAVLVAQRQVGNLNRKDFWKVVLKGSPDWVRYLVYGFLGYAVVNFMYFFFQVPTGHTEGADPPAIMWRGFSGHWMVFYLAAFAILYSAVRDTDGSTKCVNGHPIKAGASFCARCGQPAVQR